MAEVDESQVDGDFFALALPFSELVNLARHYSIRTPSNWMVYGWRPGGLQGSGTFPANLVLSWPPAGPTRCARKSPPPTGDGNFRVSLSKDSPGGAPLASNRSRATMAQLTGAGVKILDRRVDLYPQARRRELLYRDRSALGRRTIERAHAGCLCRLLPFQTTPGEAGALRTFRMDHRRNRRGATDKGLVARQEGDLHERGFSDGGSPGEAPL